MQLAHANQNIIAAPQDKEPASCGLRKCQECGNNFKLLQSGRRVYCSEKCYNDKNKRWYHEKYLRIRKLKIFKSKCCVICGKNFIPHRKDQMSCHACHKKLGNFKRSQKALEDFINRKPRECIICGVFFKPKRKDSFCCSNTHRRYSYQKLSYHKRKYKSPIEAIEAAKQNRRNWYYKHRDISLERSREYFKKPERKEKIRIYKEYGKGANPPEICKKILAIKHAINHGTLHEKITQISEGKTYEAYI
jgi:hypothetical protein